jgi:thiol-disulfide isomerase/thioredoxin
MRTHVTAAAGLVLALSAPAFAQDGADAPANAVAPAAPAGLPKSSVKSPAEGWTDAEKGADQVAKGTAALDAAQKAYQAAPEMTDRAAITVRMPDGEQNETIEMAFGKGNDMDVRMGSLQIMAVGDSVYFVPDQPADKYLTKKIATNAHATLGELLPGFSLPAPDLALRQPLPGRPVVEAFALGGMEGMAVKGFRERGGMQEVLIGTNGADGVVSLDPKSSMVKGVSVVFTPEGLPAEFKIGFDVALNPVLGAPKAPIAFNAGTRTAASGVEELFAAPPEAEEPETKVKVGDAAPVSMLETLDGKTIDLAAMKGKVVVIDFWATWCGPCRKGLPLLQKFADDMKSNDKVVVLPVNVWEQEKGEALRKKVGEWWEKQKYTMQVALDPEAKLIEQYGFKGIPACIVIGPDGKLVASHMGYSANMAETLAADVNKALGTK